ncbi:MAG: hypothetical protein Q8O83_00265 [bacterium]|nr:hypothetical protein [bacterium]
MSKERLSSYESQKKEQEYRNIHQERTITDAFEKPDVQKKMIDMENWSDKDRADWKETLTKEKEELNHSLYYEAAADKNVDKEDLRKQIEDRTSSLEALQYSALSKEEREDLSKRRETLKKAEEALLKELGHE